MNQVFWPVEHPLSRRSLFALTAASEEPKKLFTAQRKDDSL